ncbi:hypothetical protein HDU98_002769, partial [Podochytrium sp. JEL0797]
MSFDFDFAASPDLQIGAPAIRADADKAVTDTGNGATDTSKTHAHTEGLLVSGSTTPMGSASGSPGGSPVFLSPLRGAVTSLAGLRRDSLGLGLGDDDDGGALASSSSASGAALLSLLNAAPPMHPSVARDEEVPALPSHEEAVRVFALDASSPSAAPMPGPEATPDANNTPSSPASVRLPRLASRSAAELRVAVAAPVLNTSTPDLPFKPATRQLSKSASSIALTMSREPVSPVTNNGTVKEIAPVVLDRYGFSRSFQYVSKEDYEAFDRYYNVITQRRTRKWESLLKRTGGQLPARSEKLKRYIRKGIPYHLRESCWFHYSGAEKYMSNNPGLFSMLTYKENSDRNLGYTKEKHKVLEFIDILERDLHRTFPENALFNSKLNAATL